MDRIETLTTDELLQLLSTASVGRIAVTRDALPVILPVNYVVDGMSLVIRTTDGAILRAAQAGGAVVAFEVDNLDERTMTGWSVLVTGTLREVTAVSAVLRAEQLPLAPGPAAPTLRPHHSRPGLWPSHPGGGCCLVDPWTTSAYCVRLARLRTTYDRRALPS